nr:mamu class II histocompatibility antigen, DR alpha chain-like [Chelonoidis abingdonii]
MTSQCRELEQSQRHPHSPGERPLSWSISIRDRLAQDVGMGPFPSRVPWLPSGPRAGTGRLRDRQWDPLTPVSPVPPEMTAFPEDHVELGEPNILICFMDNFSPPVLSLTWLKNGQEVTEGVSKTDFYPCQDNSFCKFSYLPFLPSQSDFYDYQVEHVGAARALHKALG